VDTARAVAEVFACGERMSRTLAAIIAAGVERPAAGSPAAEEPLAGGLRDARKRGSGRRNGADVSARRRGGDGSDSSDSSSGSSDVDTSSRGGGRRRRRRRQQQQPKSATSQPSNPVPGATLSRTAVGMEVLWDASSQEGRRRAVDEAIRALLAEDAK
jgi:hypothetical protein